MRSTTNPNKNAKKSPIRQPLHENIGSLSVEDSSSLETGFSLDDGPSVEGRFSVEDGFSAEDGFSLDRGNLQLMERQRPPATTPVGASIPPSINAIAGSPILGAFPYAPNTKAATN